MAQSIFFLAILLAPPQAGRVSFRVITVATEGKAAELRARIAAGESFAALASENSTDSSASAGGFMGTFAPADLRREFQTALAGLRPGQVSPVVRMGNEFLLLQLVAPEEAGWIANNEAGLDALQKKRYPEAVRSLSEAVQLAEKFGPDDDRLGQSLNALREAYGLQQDYAAAAAVSRRILAIRWSAASNTGQPAVADLIDRLTDLLSLSYFRGSRFDEAAARYKEALNSTPASEALYLAMSYLLDQAELWTEAEDVMERAIRAYPESRRVRYKEAEMYRDSGRMRKALETFALASRMKAPASMTPKLDALQLSFIYQRMGGINNDLTQFDDALAAYKKAVDISPDNADARIGLGDMYLRRGRPPDALAEYNTVLAAHADRDTPHYRLADAYLQMGNFAEAAAAAARALAIDPRQRKARYVRGIALVRMGRATEGQKELEEYRKEEAAAQTLLNDQRDILVSNRGASALVLSGQGEEAVALFRRSIEAHPKSEELHLNLGLAFGILGRHREAASTLQGLLDSGLTADFAVEHALAREYESLKDGKAGQQHNALYIQKIDAALEAALQ